LVDRLMNHRIGKPRVLQGAPGKSLDGRYQARRLSALGSERRLDDGELTGGNARHQRGAELGLGRVITIDGTYRNASGGGDRPEAAGSVCGETPASRPGPTLRLQPPRKTRGPIF